MKVFNLLPVILGLIMTAHYSSAQSAQKDITGISREASRQLKDLVRIEGGTFTMGRTMPFAPGKYDTTLLGAPIPQHTEMKTFYISDHEVTNAEYALFVKWVTDSLRNEQLAGGDSSFYKRPMPPDKMVYTYYDRQKGEQVSMAIYPDTAVWMTEFSAAFSEPMAVNYFQHPAYNDYPVVGISYHQAMAYCNWKTAQFYNALKLKGKGYKIHLEFRLPTAAEWEYAALCGPPEKKEKRVTDRLIFPWYGYELRNFEGRYLANFGAIEDQSGLLIKSYLDDQYLYTAPVRSFTGNLNGLYDMAGNVAEWVTDSARANVWEDSLQQQIQIYPDDNLETAIQKILLAIEIAKANTSTDSIDPMTRWRRAIQLNDDLHLLDTNNAWGKEKIMMWARMEMHNAEVLAQTPGARIVKGGSWASGPVYMLGGNREIFSAGRSSSRIGFRVVIGY